MRKVFHIIVALLLVYSFAACEKKGNDKASGKAAKVDRVIVKKFLLEKAPVKFDVPVDINYANKIKILGLDFTPKPLKHGEFYTITFYYEVLGEMDTDYLFFGHFEPKNGERFRDKMDHKPLLGQYPTSQWQKGEILKDVFKGKVSKPFPGVEGILWGGFYRDNDRLPIANVSQAKDDGQSRGRLAVLPLDEPIEEKTTYVVYKDEGTLTIDGKLDEDAWQAVPWTKAFVNTNGQRTQKPKTRAKMLYDDKYFYVAFDCEDNDIWSDYKKNDEPLYKQETTEVMIDADGSQSTYIELQVNAHNALFDAYFPKVRKGMQLDWSSKVVSAVDIDGTLDKRDDTDKGWTVEMAIPYGSIADAPNTPPKAGNKWRLNLFRMERPKKRGTIAAMWSPVFVGDFHTLNRWGEVVFSETTAKNAGKVKKLKPSILNKLQKRKQKKAPPKEAADK